MESNGTAKNRSGSHLNTEEANDGSKSPHSDEKRGPASEGKAGASIGAKEEAGVGGENTAGEHDGGTGTAITSESEIRVKVEHLFPQYTSGGFLYREEFIDLLAQLGLATTEDELASYSQITKIDLDTAVDIAQQIRLSRMNVAQQEASKTSKQIENVGVWAYIKMKLTCSAKRGVQYNVVLPQCDFELTPRKILLSGTGIVTMLTGMCVIATLAIMWVLLQSSNEVSYGEMVGDTVLNFGEQFEQAVLSITGEEGGNECDVLSQFFDETQGIKRKAMLAQIEHNADLMVSTGDLVIDSRSIEAELAATTSRLRTLDLVRQLRSRTLSVALASLPTNTPWEYAVWNHTSGNATVRPPGCASCTWSVPCLANRSSSEVRQWNVTVDFRGRSAAAVSLYIAALNISICGTLNRGVVVTRAQQAYVSMVANAAMQDTFANRQLLLEQLLAIPVDGMSLSRIDVNWLRQSPHLCAFNVNNVSTTTCGNNLDTFVGRCLILRQSNSSQLKLTLSSTVRGVVCSTVPSKYNVAVMLCSNEDNWINNERQTKVNIANGLNFEYTRRTELVVATRDETTGVITPQATRYRFADECFGVCSRSAAASVSVNRAFSSKGFGYVIAPDYRPVAVVSSYGYMSELDVVLSVELDVVDMRATASFYLEEVINTINNVLNDMEIIAVRPVQYPPCATFSPSAACPTGVTCQDVSGFGVVYRSDCVHCVRLVDGKVTSLKAVSALKQGTVCSSNGLNCTSVDISKFSLYRRPFSSAAREVNFGKSYTGSQVLIATALMSNLSIGLSIEWPRSTYQQPIIEKVGISIGVAGAIVVVCLLGLMIQSRHYLDSIEEEWSNYKTQIKEETRKFALSVVEILPATVAEKLMKKSDCICTSQTLTAIFIDIFDFRKLSAAWDAEYSVEYLSYVNHVYGCVAQFFNIHKVRTIGDIAFFLGGIEEEADIDTVSRVACNCVKAASAIMTAFSYMFTHQPSAVTALREVAKSTRALETPHIRVGIHTGACTTAVIMTSATPNFDAFGINVSAASHLCDSAKRNTINISLTVREALERRNMLDLFEFNEERRVQVKSTVFQCVMIKAANVAVPPPVIAALGMRRAHTRMYFSEDARSGSVPQGGGQTGAPPPSSGVK